jgi:4-amino-4-deoxy-L-arabinose transferase-like glycosyltransferase
VSIAGNEDLSVTDRATEASAARPWKQAGWSAWPIVGGLTTLGAVLRGYHLGSKSLWYDEAVQYWISSEPLQDLVASNEARNSAPPLFSMLLRLVILGFGDSEAVLRSLSWFGGTAAIPAIYLLARRFLDRVPAYFVAMMVAVSPMQVRYSQQVREYSLTFLLAAVILICCHSFWRKPDIRRSAAVAAAFIAGAFLQYGLSVLAGGLFLVLGATALRRTPDRGRRVTQLTGILLVWAAALIAVYFLSAREQSRAVGSVSDALTGYLRAGFWSGSLPALPGFVVRNTFSLIEATFPADVFLLLFVVGFLVVLRPRNDRFPLLGLLVPTAVVFLLGCTVLYPYGGGRQDIFLMPMIFVTAGFGVWFLFDVPGRRGIAAFAAAVLLLGGLRETRRYLIEPGTEELRPLVRKMKAAWQAGDRVYVYARSVPAFRYYDRGGGSGPVILGRKLDDREALGREIHAAAAEPGRLWVVFSHCGSGGCDLVHELLARERPIEKVSGDDTAWLGLAAAL